VGKAAGA